VRSDLKAKKIGKLKGESPKKAKAEFKPPRKVQKDRHSNILGSIQKVTGLKPFNAADPTTIPAQRIHFTRQNPKCPGTRSYRRYERYKNSQTLKGFYGLGGTTVDLKNDIAKGYARFYS